MRRIKQCLPMTLLALAFNCGKKCDIFISRTLPVTTEEYFGVYKPGNWWVYQNSNGTKRDSIYLVRFADTIIKNKTNCTASQLRTFTLHAMYLANTNDIAATYEAAGTTIHFNMEAPGTRFPSFTYFIGENLIRSLPSPENTGNNLLDSIILNGTRYNNILIGKESPATYYFGKNRGLVGWATSLDTFNLVKFQIM